MLDQDGGMLDQCSTRLVTCLSSAILVSFRLGRCSNRFVTCSPMILANAEMLDMQSALQHDMVQPLGEN